MKQVQKPKKPLIVYYIIVLAVLLVFNFFVFPMMTRSHIEEVDYGTFLNMVEEKTGLESSAGGRDDIFY